MLSELKRGFENKTPLIAFTDQTLPKKQIKEMEQKYPWIGRSIVKV
ncbi:hypothetical protein [Acinetobacter baumannii]|nr:hypothetical protein [Acinetobacter baumannii]